MGTKKKATIVIASPPPPPPQPYVAGQRYFLSVQFVLCAGPVDALHRLDYGERALWRGWINGEHSFYIDQPTLFGGEDNEGGVVGLFHLLMGHPTQARNSFLQSITNAFIPAYRGFVSLIAQDVMWSSNTPYFRSLWAGVTRVFNGWQRAGGAWYPEKAAIARYTENYSIYYIDVEWEPQKVRAPQTINYRLETKSVTDADFVLLGEYSFAGGLRPNQNSEIGGGANQDDFFTLNHGIYPSGVRGAQFTLEYKSREFRVVKTGGTIEVIEGDVDSGLSFGGNVVVKNSFTSVPGYQDMNPAHILWQLLTEDIWQMRIPESMLDDAVWRETADKLHLENFGLSFALSTSVTTRDHIQRVLNHINGYFKEDLATGKIGLYLIRGDYDPEMLLELNNSNSKLESFSRTTGSKQVNEIVVKYRDDNEDLKISAPASNMSNIAKFGVIKSEVEYEGVHTEALAYQLARRDVKVASSELVRMTRTTNRILWNHGRGDVVLITDENVGMDRVPYRILNITKNTEVAGGITVDMVEDVFGYELNNDTQVAPPPDFLLETLPNPHSSVFLEMPFYLLATQIGDENAINIDDEVGFALGLATRSLTGALSASYNFYTSLDDYTYTGAMGGCSYVPTATLDSGIGRLDTEFYVTNLKDFYASNFDGSGEVIGLIDNEFIALDAYNDTTGLMTVRRGVLDTVPVEHNEDAVVRIFLSSTAFDSTVRLAGDTVYFKLQPEGNGNSPRIYDLDSTSMSFNSRAARPYNAGRFAINSVLFPDEVSGALTLTWAHRDRTLQTTNVVPHEASSIGPEPLTVYNVQVFDADTNTLKATYNGITGASKLIPHTDILGVKNIRITLESQRETLTSWQKHDHTTPRYGYGLRWGVRWGK